MPNLFEIVPLKSGMAMADMPFPEVPYYVIDSESLYIRKNTAVGVVTIKTKEFPKNLSKADIKSATLALNMTPIPRSIIEQSWGFFRHVFEKREAEAEVLLLFNDKTKQYRLFCPHQSTSYGGVDSLYDPADIPQGFVVMGSLHSHCDFEAFHSNTDTSDASDFNGVHFTLGKVDSKQPEIASMIMINKIMWEYDYSKLTTIREDARLRPRAFPMEWMSMFGSKQEIVNRPFKSLTDEALTEWLDTVKFNAKWNTKKKSSYPVTSYTSWDKDYDDDGSLDWYYKNRTSYLNSDDKWSWQFKLYLPKKWLNGAGDVKEDYLRDALEAKMNTVVNMASDYGFDIAYDIRDMLDDRFTETGAIGSNSSKALIKVKDNDMLPGPFAVKEE